MDTSGLRADLDDALRRFELAVDLAEIGCWTADPGRDHVAWDNRAAALLSHGSDAGSGPLGELLVAVPSDDVEALRLAMKEALANGAPFRLLHRVTSDSQVRWVEQRGRPLSVANGTDEPQQVAGVAMDVTERVEADQQLAAALASERTARARTEAAFTEAQEVAETLQQSLLPIELPRVPGVELGALYRSSPTSPALVGGDFYDVFSIDRHDWGLVVGDVCGKGPEAAVLTARIRHGVRALASRSRRTDTLVADVDDTLDTASLGHRFCTLVYARFTPLVDGIDVRLTRAGHEAPLLVRADGSVEEVGQAGPVVGVANLGGWHEQRVRLRLGDQLAIFTDGVTELRADDGEMFGGDRLREALTEVADARSVNEIVRHLDEQLRAFQDEPRDDIALVLVRAPALRDRQESR